MTTPADTTSIDQGQRSLTDLAAAVEAATDPLARLSVLAALAKLISTIQRASVFEARSGGQIGQRTLALVNGSGVSRCCHGWSLCRAVRVLQPGHFPSFCSRHPQG